MRHQSGKPPAIVPIALNAIEQKENSRANYAPTELAELMVSMKQTGLLQAIGVVELPGKKERYEVAYGNRRYTAAKKLGWTVIDCIIMEPDDKEDMMIVNTVENMQRVDVPLTEQGRIFDKLVKEGMTAQQIAVRVGITVDKVRNALELYYQMPKEFRGKVVSGESGRKKEEGTIPARTAFGALSIAKRFGLDQEDTKRLFRYAEKKGVTGDHVRVLAGLLKNGMTFDRALNLAEHVKMVAVFLPLQKKKIPGLEKREGKKIHQIIYDRLLEYPELGLIRYLNESRSKPPIRKAAKAN